MVEAFPTADGQLMMYIAGDGGETGTYQENLEELGLFQDLDASKVFNLEETTEHSVDNLL